MTVSYDGVNKTCGAYMATGPDCKVDDNNWASDSEGDYSDERINHCNLLYTSKASPYAAVQPGVKRWKDGKHPYVCVRADNSDLKQTLVTQNDERGVILFENRGCDVSTITYSGKSDKDSQINEMGRAVEIFGETTFICGYTSGVWNDSLTKINFQFVDIPGQNVNGNSNFTKATAESFGGIIVAPPLDSSGKIGGVKILQQGSYNTYSTDLMSFGLWMDRFAENYTFTSTNLQSLKLEVTDFDMDIDMGLNPNSDLGLFATKNLANDLPIPADRSQRSNEYYCGFGSFYIPPHMEVSSIFYVDSDQMYELKYTTPLRYENAPNKDGVYPDIWENSYLYTNVAQDYVYDDNKHYPTAKSIAGLTVRPRTDNFISRVIDIITPAGLQYDAYNPSIDLVNIANVPSIESDYGLSIDYIINNTTLKNLYEQSMLTDNLNGTPLFITNVTENDAQEYLEYTSNSIYIDEVTVNKITRYTDVKPYFSLEWLYLLRLVAMGGFLDLYASAENFQVSQSVLDNMMVNYCQIKCNPRLLTYRMLKNLTCYNGSVVDCACIGPSLVPGQQYCVTSLNATCELGANSTTPNQTAYVTSGIDNEDCIECNNCNVQICQQASTQINAACEKIQDWSPCSAENINYQDQECTQNNDVTTLVTDIPVYYWVIIILIIIAGVLILIIVYYYA